MKRLKRILSVLLLISLLPLLPLTVGANDDTPATTTPQTVYVSSSGNDTTAAVGDKTKPFKDFLTAYGNLTATGGTVVLLDDVTIDLQGVTKIGDAIRIYLPESEHLIAVCGVYHEDTQAYSALCLTNGSAGVCFEQQGDVVFYDMIFRVQFAQNLFFAANGYDLTFGFHITNETASSKYGVNIIAGAQNSAGGVAQNPNGGPNISVYSGNWDRVRANSFQNLSMNGDCNLYLYGGSFNGITMMQKSTYTKNLGGTIHYFGGTITSISGMVPEGKTSTLILYNGAVLGVTPTTAFTETKTLTAPIPAPAYALDFYGMQTTAVSAENTYSARFVGTLNSIDYSAVGLRITTDTESGIVYGGCCTEVYTSILGNFERYTAEELGGNYIFAWTIEDIPSSVGEITFTVTPFLAIGETVYYGEAKTITHAANIPQA